MVVARHHAAAGRAAGPRRRHLPAARAAAAGRRRPLRRRLVCELWQRRDRPEPLHALGLAAAAAVAAAARRLLGPELRIQAALDLRRDGEGRSDERWAGSTATTL